MRKSLGVIFSRIFPLFAILFCLMPLLSCLEKPVEEDEPRIRTSIIHPPNSQPSDNPLRAISTGDAEITVFDRHGQIIAREPYHWLREEWHYAIDHEGNISHMALKRNATNTIQRMYTFKYDDDGKIMESISYFPFELKTEWAYDRTGRLTERDVYFLDDTKSWSISRRFAPSYDDRGNVVKESVYYASGSPELASTLEYDVNGRLTQSSWYSPSFITEGAVDLVGTVKYDGMGNEIEVISYSRRGDGTEFSSTTAYECREYNEHSHCTKRIASKVDEYGTWQKTWCIDITYYE